MSENNDVKNTAEAGNSTEKMLSQSEVDRVVQERLAREREKFADYEDLKGKAEKLDQLEAANQSELEKAIARAEAAEKAAQDAENARRAAEVQSLRVRVAGEKGVPANLVKYITGDSQEAIEAAAEELAAVQPQPQQGYVPTAGMGGSAPDHEGDAAERAKAWLGRK